MPRDHLTLYRFRRLITFGTLHMKTIYYTYYLFYIILLSSNAQTTDFYAFIENLWETAEAYRIRTMKDMKYAKYCSSFISLLVRIKL